MMKRRLWLTYAWRDNELGDVDYLLQELKGKGLDVRYDRATLRAGLPLWDQLDQQIDWNNIDAWAIYVTRNSLESGPCREELGNALTSAIGRGRMTLPLIGIFPEPVDPEMVPKAISSRLYVVLTTPTAIQDIVDGVTGEKSERKTDLPPIGWQWHKISFGSGLALEFWPRIGAFSNVFVGYSHLTTQEHLSPALAPFVGTRGETGFGNGNFGRSGNNIRIFRNGEFDVFFVGMPVSYGQGATAIVPMTTSDRTRVLVGGTDASGRVVEAEIPFPSDMEFRRI